MGISPEKYSVSSSQILVNWKYDHRDDDVEQFASAGTRFPPPNSTLVKLQIWGYLERNTVPIPHKYM